MQVRFWGTRGSIAKPGPTTVRYGGNTSCVEIVSNDGTRLILDCGTGIHGLGQALMATGEQPLKGHILIGHTHWDHIQGFPFFAPLFVPGNQWDIYAPTGLSVHLQDVLAGQMEYTYFPVSLEQLGATIRYHDLLEGTFTIGGITVTTQYLNHPALTMSYRIEADGATVLYATDHEPHCRDAAMAEAEPGQAPMFQHHEDQRHADFLAGVDLLIHDTQYTAAEYPAHVGWGHSTVEYVVDMALAARVKRLALFHHDPMRTDDAVDALVVAANQRVSVRGAALDLFAAAEGQVIELVGDVSVPRAPQSDPQVLDLCSRKDRMVVAATAHAPLLAMLRDVAAGEGLELAVASNGVQVLELAERLRPVAFFVDRALPELDGLSIGRELLEHPDPELGGAPLILVDGAFDASLAELAKSCGVADWLVLPCSPQYVRTKLRAWMMRSRLRWCHAAMPGDEAERMEHVRALGLLDTAPEERFDRLARLAARALNVPVALISLMDSDRQWFKASTDPEFVEAPRDMTVCGHALLRDEPLIIADGLSDPDFGGNPAFAEQGYRFYAGINLRDGEGFKVGTLCLLDRRPRMWGPGEMQALGDLACLIEHEFGKALVVC